MADLSVTGGNTPRIDTERWKRLTPQEILKQESLGEEIPAEIVAWAQQMTAFSKIPDNVTYELVDGDVGIDALSRLGIEDEDALNPEANNAIKGSETEDPDAVKDPARTGELPPEGDEPVPPPPPQPGYASDAESPDEDNFENDEFSLADTELTTDPDEIRKRKERKGIPQ
ncbi:hypothetical protein J6P92_05680 [bacterium]|nr:hypothetical protein [bacterium]